MLVELVLMGLFLMTTENLLSAADSLHHMIMEYAKVYSGGESSTVTLSREVTIK